MIPATRAEAKAAGVKHYAPGTPCPKGHIAPRFASCGYCTACSRQRADAKAGELSAYYRRRYQANRDEIRAATRLRHARNRDRNNATAKRWAAKNPDLVREYKRKNKHKRRAVVGVFTARDLARLLDIQRGACGATGPSTSSAQHCLPTWSTTSSGPPRKATRPRTAPIRCALDSLASTSIVATVAPRLHHASSTPESRPVGQYEGSAASNVERHPGANAPPFSSRPTMPFSAEQLVIGATYALNSFQKKEPVDQINYKHAILDWLVKGKEASTFGNGYFKQPLYYQNGSNYQNYFGADQVTYNERDPAKWAEWAYFAHHDGFWFDEDRLAADGIVLTDDKNAQQTDAEKIQLINVLKQSYRALKDGIQENLAFELLRDGSQSTKACPGLEHIIDPTPAVGTVGGINSANFTWWQNNANTSITASAIVAEMEETWMDCMRRGGEVPDFIPCGRTAYETYRTYANATVDRFITGPQNSKGGVTVDAATAALNFHGVPVVWDPTLDALDTLLSSSTRTKTMYFLNSKHLKLRPMSGHWMVNRKPERLPDRYVHYFGQTSKYGLTSDKRNCQAVITIA